MIGQNPPSRGRLDEGSAESYRTLLDSIDQGFCICQLLIDTAGVPYDYRFLEVNRLFTVHSGLHDAVGQTARTLVPDLEAHWVEMYGRVALERESIRFEQASPALGRSFEVYAFPFGPADRLTFAVLFTEVTDRKRSDELLRRTQARLHAALEAGLAGTFYWDVRTNRVSTDANMMRYFAVSPSALEDGVPLEDLLRAIHDEDRARVANALRDAVERTDQYEVEYRVNHADGRLRWLSARGAVERDAAGQAVGLPGFTIDITDRKQAEEERERLLQMLQDERARLQTSEERYRAIVESQTEMVCRFRPDGNILFVNAAYAKSRGTTPEPLIGHNFWGFVAAADQPAVRAQLAGLTPQTPEVRIENRFHTSEGVRWLLWTNRGLSFDSAGRATEVQSTGIDITDRKRREGHTALLADISHTLAHASDDERIMDAVAERLGRHLHASRCVFNEYDRSAGVITVTHDWCEDQGASLKGQYRLHDFFSDHALEMLAAGRILAINDVASDPCTRDRHAHFAALDIGALVNTPYVRDGEWRGSLTVHRRAPCTWLTDEIELMQDLSSWVWASIERSRVTQRLRESEAALRYASRLKDEFLATLSHELRTPLNAVLGWAHLLRTTTLPPDVATRGLEALERNARVQGQLVDDLLDMSRIVAGKLQIVHEAVELPMLLASAVETVAPTAAAKGVSLVMTGTDEGPCYVSGDADRIRQIVWNLVSNAIKFTPAGGTVEVSMRKTGGHIDIIVRDTGEGIDALFLPQMFERFRQADATTTRRHGGLGLGLAIVRHLTEAHGGTVAAESAGRDLGATIRVRFPAMGSSSMTVPEAAPARPAAAPLDARVLIVDDEGDALDLFRALLEARGARVTTARSAGEALEHLGVEPFDIMLSDVGMPGQDGLSLIQSLRKSPGPNTSLPAVAVTAFAGPADRERVLRAGYQHHVAKPVEPDHLLQVIGTVLGRGSGPGLRL